MRKLRMSLAGLAVVAAVACAPAPVAEEVMMAGSAADEAAIEAHMQSVATAWNAKDVAALTAMVAEDFQGIGADGVHTVGRAAYEAANAADFAEERPEGMMLSIDTGYIHWHSYDMATAGGTFMVAGVPEGSPSSGAWMANFTRTDMGWLMSNSLVSQFTPETMDDSGGQ